MADTKWDDPGIDWEDETLSTSMNAVSAAYDACRGASDERNAYFNETHSAGFVVADTWPDFATGLIPLRWEVTKAFALEDAALYEATIDPETIDPGGTFDGSQNLTTLTLAGLLTQLGHGNRFAHMVDSDEGDLSAIAQMLWLKQWYQVLNFPVYQKVFPSTETDGKRFYLKIVIEYRVTGSTFDSCTAFVTNPQFTTAIDIYNGGDLPEGSPLATEGDVRTYAQGIFDTYIADDDKWDSPATPFLGTFAEISSSEASGDIDLTLEYLGYRWKQKQGFRPTSPDKFDVPYFFYGYYSIAFGNNMGTGITDDLVLFDEIIADGNDHYHFWVDSPVFDQDLVDSRVNRIAISAASGTPQILKRPNLEDGTGWEYYIPAP